MPSSPHCQPRSSSELSCKSKLHRTLNRTWPASKRVPWIPNDSPILITQLLQLGVKCLVAVPGLITDLILNPFPIRQTLLRNELQGLHSRTALRVGLTLNCRVCADEEHL